MSGHTPLWWRLPGSRPAAGSAPRLVVVTDIDGSLLAPGSRSLPHERAALDFLAARGVPLVVNSSRTRVEIERLRQSLHLLTPFISEHGSALFVPDGTLPFLPEGTRPAVGGRVIEFGRRYHDVVDLLALTSRDTGIEVVPFAQLTIEEVARELDVAVVEAQLIKLREYTELFRIVDETEATRSRLSKALRRRGLRCWPAGGHHLAVAAADRAASLRTLKTLWRQAWGDPVFIGFGDSEDDVAWLQHCDVAIIVKNHRTGVPPRVFSKLPTVHVTRWPGRHGWSAAVVEFVGALLCSRSQTAPANASDGVV